MSLSGANSIAGLATALTGLVGAIGGAGIAYLSLRHTLDKDRHKVEVDLSKSLLINVPGIPDDEQQFVIQISNLGTVPFTVGGIGISIGRHSGGLAIPIPKGSHPIGTVLERDKTCNFWIKYDDVVQGAERMAGRSHIKLRAYARDYAGNTFKSKWVDLRFKATWASNARGKCLAGYKSAIKFVFP